MAAADGGSAAAGGARPLDAEDARLLQGFGDHPLMERVQRALQKQLKEKYDRVAAELRERREDAARAAKEREELGVDLYGVQQQLAKLQISLETAQTNAKLIAEVRAKAESDLTKFRVVRERGGGTRARSGAPRGPPRPRASWRPTCVFPLATCRATRNARRTWMRRTRSWRSSARN
jgi:hypothetical protein